MPARSTFAPRLRLSLQAFEAWRRLRSLSHSQRVACLPPSFSHAAFTSAGHPRPRHQASPAHPIDYSPARARAATLVLKSRRRTTEIQFVTSSMTSSATRSLRRQALELRWHIEAECRGGLEVDHQIELLTCFCPARNMQSQIPEALYDPRCICIAIRTSSARLRAPIRSMTQARWFSTVFALIFSCIPINNPATTSSMT
jgi:hypothetical protein